MQPSPPPPPPQRRRQQQQTDEPQAAYTSFRRFGADVEARGASETWASLRTETAPLLADLLHRRQDLYKAEVALCDSLKLSFLPRIQDCRSANKGALESARWLQVLLSEHLTPQDSTKTEAEADIVICLNRSEIQNLQHHLSAWINHSQRMVACCESAIKSTKKSNQALADLDTKVRSFIYNLWGFMAERGKAFPPYFKHLGPLQPSLYGMGHVAPDPPAKAPAT